jgi:hypothetical protein
MGGKRNLTENDLLAAVLEGAITFNYYCELKRRLVRERVCCEG